MGGDQGLGGSLGISGIWIVWGNWLINVLVEIPDCNTVREGGLMKLLG